MIQFERQQWLISLKKVLKFKLDIELLTEYFYHSSTTNPDDFRSKFRAFVDEMNPESNQLISETIIESTQPVEPQLIGRSKISKRKRLS
jgi:hypothetical protein